MDLVHKRVAQDMYTGTCLRNYSSSCPEGMALLNRDTMRHLWNTSDSAGTWLRRKVMRARLKLAQSCFASWPCNERRPLNFSGCPENWTQDGKSCVAPKSYRGMCASVTDFCSYSIVARAELSTMCQAPWLAQIRVYVEWLSNERCLCQWWCVSMTMSADTHVQCLLGVFSLIGR